MTEPADSMDGLGLDGADPRLGSEYLRYSKATDGEGYVVIVGVVHDHPASVFRVDHIVEVLQPDVIAVELPQLVIPLFEAFAAEDNAARNLGAEMTAALKQAGDVRQVGLDAPSLLYFRRLASHVWHGDVPAGIIWRVGKDLLRSYAQAIAIVLAALVGVASGLRLQVLTPVEHESTPADPPAEQAGAEDSHVASRRAFLRAVEIPQATRIIDTVRERVMTERLREARAHGDVVAVVGVEHLDPVYEALQDGE